MTNASDVTALVTALTREQQPFAVATVVRTLSATAAKAGAKAVILADGSMGAGWIGGGCVRGAVLRAARAAMADGQPRLISVQPESTLAAHHLAPGEEREGIHFARNACASQGVMDVFVEPVLPSPRLRIFGQSPVATVLARLAPDFGFAVERDATGPADPRPDPAGFVVVATQGRGDAEALRAALTLQAPYTAFVGSPRKVETLKQALRAADYPAGQLDRLHGPAGLDIGAVTPEEIALSILAEMIRDRRQRRSVTEDPVHE